MPPRPPSSLPQRAPTAPSERPGGTDAVLRLIIVYSPEPRQVHEVDLEVADGATVMDVLRASELPARFPDLARAEVVLGIWGKKVGPEQLVQAGDRVEIYRPLRVDPKVARRTRFEAQGARSAGLFARRRPGAKAGY